MNCAKEYANALVSMTDHPLAKLIISRGVEGRGQALPQKYRAGEMKQCYRNAAHLAQEHRELTYVEGYASSIIPTEHAWCIDEEGNVIDNTWIFDEVLPEDQTYIGLAFDTKFLTVAILEQGYYGILSEFWRSGYTIEAIKGGIIDVKA